MKPDPKNVISYLTGALMSRATVDIRRELLARDGDCCHFCKAPGGATILRVNHPWQEVYVDLGTLIAYDANDGTRLGDYPEDKIPLGKSRRVVLDLAYLDGNPGNLGRKGRRPNVVLACQRCNTAQGMAAIAKAEDDKRKAEAEAEYGPELPLFG
jgi:5-methylcytosine-specific restriction endonuclease McrA